MNYGRIRSASCYRNGGCDIDGEISLDSLHELAFIPIPARFKLPTVSRNRTQKLGWVMVLLKIPAKVNLKDSHSHKMAFVSFHDRGTLLGARTTIPWKNFLTGCYVRVPESSSFAPQWRYLNVALFWGVSRLFLSFYVVTTSLLSSVLVVCYVLGWPPNFFSTFPVLYLKVKIDDTDTKVRSVKGPHINQHVGTVPSIF